METAERLLISARDAAAMCSVAVSTWYSWLSSGRVPAPLRLGGRVLWRRGELEAWVDAGCPPRCKWEVMEEGSATRWA
jgi:prophage regulatory protein